jgi:hypothetical protein
LKLLFGVDPVNWVNTEEQLQRRNRKMIDFVMIVLHIFALIFFMPALLVTIPIHFALAKLM